MVILIQLVFGIVFLSTIIALVLGRRVGLKNRRLLSEDVGKMEWKGLLTLRKTLIIYTFCAEIIGGILYHSAISLYW